MCLRERARERGWNSAPKLDMLYLAGNVGDQSMSGRLYKRRRRCWGAPGLRWPNRFPIFTEQIEVQNSQTRVGFESWWQGDTWIKGVTDTALELSPPSTHPSSPCLSPSSKGLDEGFFLFWYSAITLQLLSKHIHMFLFWLHVSFLSQLIQMSNIFKSTAERSV